MTTDDVFLQKWHLTAYVQNLSLMSKRESDLNDVVSSHISLIRSQSVVVAPKSIYLESTPQNALYINF